MTIFIVMIIIAAVIIEYLIEKKEIYNSEFLSYVRAKMVDGMKVGVIFGIIKYWLLGKNDVYECIVEVTFYIVIYMVLKILLYIFGMLFVKKSNA